MLSGFEIFAISFAGVFGILSIICLCCVCIGLIPNPLCCVGILGGLFGYSLAAGSRTKQTTVIYHTVPDSRRTYYSQQAESTPLRLQPSAPVYSVQSVQYSSLPTYEKGYNNVQYEIQPQLVEARTPTEEDRNTDRYFRDLWALIFFIFDVVVLVMIAIRYGLPFIGVLEDDLKHENIHYNGQSTSGARNVLLLCVSLAVAGNILAVIWLHIMLNTAKILISAVLWTIVCTSIVAAFLCIVADTLSGFVVFTVFSLSALVFLFDIKSRIPFASANLRVACLAVSDYFWIILVAHGLVVVQLLWTSLWIISFIGVYGKMLHEEGRDKRSTKTENSFILIFMLLSLQWGQQVIQNVLRCSVSGIVASWWYQPEQKKGIVRGAFGRSISFSLGSICFGSLIVSFIEALRNFVSMLYSRRRIACPQACLCDCLLSVFESAWRTFNRWSYIYIGIYGYDFVTASRRVYDLFYSKGLDVIMNEGLIGNVLFLGCLLVGALTSSVGIIVSKLYPSAFAGLEHPDLFLGLTGFLLGCASCMILMSVINSAVDTVFVCYAHDPYVFQLHHPTEYIEIRETWRASPYVTMHGQTSIMDG